MSCLYIAQYKQVGKMKTKRGLVSPKKASAILGLDPMTVYLSLWDGRLRGSKCRGLWRIPLSQIRRYALRRKKK